MNRRRRGGAFAAVSLAAAALTLVSACTPSSKPQAIASPGVSASGTIEFWHFFTDREADALQKVVDDFQAKYPAIKVTVKSGQDDDKMTQAIGAGNGPDVGLSFSTDIVGKFCSSGAWQDLASYISRDKVNLNDIPGPVQQYTAFSNKRCTMPFLADAYGLYYNKKMFTAAGIANPPKTFSELTDDAKKLTKLNADGSIQVAGFNPLYGYYENSAAHFGALAGAQWLTKDGKSAIGGDKAWQNLLTWQKGLIDYYGVDKLTKFQAGFGDEFSADNAFEKGQVAMNMDGEYRIASIAADAPADLDYGVAPMPVADDKADLYGAGYITGNVIGISKGSKNPEAAWQFIKYLTTDTGAVVKLANGIKNIPTINAALKSPDLTADANFKVFLQIFANPKSSTTPPSCCGTAYQDAMQTFLNDWQTGKVNDVPGGLKNVDSQINQQLGLGG
jgi:multiple sugar transport system substrate-binding protein